MLQLHILNICRRPILTPGGSRCILTFVCWSVLDLISMKASLDSLHDARAKNASLMRLTGHRPKCLGNSQGENSGVSFWLVGLCSVSRHIAQGGLEAASLLELQTCSTTLSCTVVFLFLKSKGILAQFKTHNILAQVKTHWSTLFR